MNEMMLTQAHLAARSMEAATTILDGKWKCIILSQLLAGSHRFEELRQTIPAITVKTLTRELKALQQRGLVERSQAPEPAEDLEYEVTSLGRTLEPILLALQCWAERYEGHKSSAQALQPVRIYEN